METINCPDCNNEILSDATYPAWCQSCNWNLHFKDQSVPKNKIETIYKQLGEKHSKYLFEKIKNNQIDMSLKVSPIRIICYAIATSVILLNLSLLGFGMYFLINNIIVIGLILLGLFWLSKPKWRKIPKDKFLSKTEHQEFYKLINSVCKALGTKEIEGLIITEEFNASITEYGFSKKKVIEIGLPLWTILNTGERLALIGHEISHCIHKDLTRNIIISKGMSILIDTGYAIYPEKLMSGTLAINSPAGLIVAVTQYLVLPINILLRVIANILWYIAKILNQLMWLDSQKSEYLADLSGGKISGKNYFISLMTKIGFYDYFYFELQKLSVKNNKDIQSLDLFDIFKNKINNLPKSEIDKINRLQEFEEHRLDLTHPPTNFRKIILSEKGLIEPVTLDKEIDFEKIDNDLIILKTKIQDKLIDLHRTYLNY